MTKTRTRRKRVSYFSPFVSITLVLFLTGLFSLLLLYADELKTYLKENVQVSLIFREEAKDADIIRLQKMLENESYVSRTNFISKEDAKEIMTQELGEDAEEILGFNPFPASLDVYFISDYASVDSIEVFKRKIATNNMIKEISYQRVILEKIDRNIRIGGIVILVFMLTFLTIAIVLINNTIRLTMYSKRFLIKSMQFVGATQGFIKWPFINKAITMGFFGAIIAIIVLTGLLYFIDTKISYDLIGNIQTKILMAVFLLIFGIFITVISSYYSIRKYLKSKLDDLY